ncbi:hypothetical protein [Maribacter sp. 2-571]|uniref:hypothetical protein n=1 Tax=Maribacter sp. 2-571 TaxID=3417569 RepID=UPI003D32F2C8
MKKLLLPTLLAILMGIVPCISQNTKGSDPLSSKFYLELRPIQFLLSGYSVVGHYAVSERSQLGLNVFVATLSEGITDFVWDTQGVLDLEAKQDIVLSVSYRYFLNKNKPQHNWFMGSAIGAEFYTLTNLNDSQQIPYTFFFVAPRIGYKWHPFTAKLPQLYVVGEAVVVFPIFDDGTVPFNSGATAQIGSVLPSPLVGIGIQF